MVFGGEGLFLATISGTRKALASVNADTKADKSHRTFGRNRGKEAGSILGNLLGG